MTLRVVFSRLAERPCHAFLIERLFNGIMNGLLEDLLRGKHVLATTVLRDIDELDVRLLLNLSLVTLECCRRIDWWHKTS